MDVTAGDEALWKAIELAGPVSLAESLADLPPPGVDPDWWAERSLSQGDRRHTFIALYGWAVPSRAAIAAIATFVASRRLLEVCAGSGLWARLLTSDGVRLIATDGSPDARSAYSPIETQDAEDAVRSHRECEALFFCWPPIRDDCAFRALRAFNGDRVIAAGDTRFTGDQQLHSLLEADWLLSDRVPLPTWPGLDDAVRLYCRR